MDTRHDILELSHFLTELSVIDYFFVGHRPSVVALAALLNSLEAVPGASDSSLHDYEMELKRVPGLDPSSPEVLDCRDRLQILYKQGGYNRPEIVPGEDRDETVSPVCVSQGVSHGAFGKLAEQQSPRLTELTIQ
jgi:hypothetical protein